MEKEPFDKEAWNRREILRYYEAMLPHRPNFDLDIELFIRFANILPDEFGFAKIIPIIVLVTHSKGHRQICKWEITEEGKVENFTEEGILEKLEEALADEYNFKDIDIKSVIRGWKIESLLDEV